jgi:hypothetical protein
MLTVPEATARAVEVVAAVDDLTLPDVVLVLSYAIAAQVTPTLGAAAATLVHYADERRAARDRTTH